MYLKSIEAHGFKAFANKIRLEFNQGITGIVGPNGSGKSNIADAVRWVLGEQSAKQLRGSSMQDVIFSGTENRKPLGFAYVTLTLDNTDHWLPIAFDEVTVGRRVYRSGESEYLINGSVCRLRDVQELFFDTGIGKEGYSLIGQGQIDRIISSKPEDRREIFDEAAGIVKYKRRKSAAEKNLETEKLNLSRVNDIISEIERQIGPLQKQYEKAKIYLKLKDELKAMEVSRFVADYDINKASIDELDEKLSIISNDLNNARLQYEENKLEYETLLSELEKRQNKLEETKEAKNEAVLKKQNTENEIRLLNEQILSIKAGEEHFNARMDSIRVRRDNYKNELDGYQAIVDAHDDSLKDLRERCALSEASLNEQKNVIAALMQEESDIAKKRLEMVAKSSEVRSELDKFKMMGEQYAIRRAEINAKLIAVKAELGMNESVIAEAKESLKEASNAVIDAATKCDELDEEIKEITAKIHETNDKSLKKKQEALVTESKLETLKNLSERYEGYGSAVRKIMEVRDEKPGICGVVADLIKADDDLEIAIETALGGNIQNIIVESGDTAKELIAYLKEGKFGRATFIPLDDISAKKDEFDSSVFTMKGVIGVASSLVKNDRRYDEAIKYLLGRFLVVDTIDNAQAIERKYHFKYRIVTKGGELFAPGGAISGGSFRNNSNLLGRKREVDELNEKLEKAREQMAALDGEVAELRAKRDGMKAELEAKKAELSELYVEQNTAKININHANEQTEEINKRLSGLKNEYETLEEENKELNSTLANLGVEIESNDALNKEEEKRAEAMAKKLVDARLEEERLNKINIVNLTELHTAEAGISHVTENIDRVNRELDALSEEEKELLASKADSLVELEKRNKSIEDAKAEAENLSKLIDSLNNSIDELNGATEEMAKQNKSFFDLSQSLTNQISNLDKEEFRLKNQKERLSEIAESNIKYMWEEYELTITSAKTLLETMPELNVTKKDVYELRGKIRALGDVNVNSIEEYKATSERYEFLKTQRDDIVKAQNVLEDIIEELDVDMRKQFTETFAEISKRFDATFKELFGGGMGTLELTEDEDVLDAGIKIIAQPPGKKLQNMMQLSGGEKALTAISLVFAILDLKPSPFCLLDEIEAALDDSNVNRFANYLKKLTDNTQFIVITHRRGTMAAADALYGITMQEKGVSTLVSVNLVESELK